MGSRAGLHEVSATAQCAGEVAERRRDECVIGPEQLHADRQRAAVVRDARLGIAAAVDGHGEVVQQRGDPRVIAAEALGRRGDRALPATSALRGSERGPRAFAADTKHSFAFDPTPYMGALTNGVVGSQKAFKVYSATLHQHLLGSRSKIEILHENAPTECLLDIPRWDFHWQRSYGFKTPKVCRPGDRLNVECPWDNSAEAQPVIDGVKRPPQDVNWGEGTASEMCLGVLYITE